MGFIFNTGCFFDSNEKTCYQKEEFCADYTDKERCSLSSDPGMNLLFYLEYILYIYIFFFKTECTWVSSEGKCRKKGTACVDHVSSSNCVSNGVSFF
jgi:hypothetical protein